jgi:hypothetical protein
MDEKDVLQLAEQLGDVSFGDLVSHYPFTYKEMLLTGPQDNSTALLHCEFEFPPGTKSPLDFATPHGREGRKRKLQQETQDLTEFPQEFST